MGSSGAQNVKPYRRRSARVARRLTIVLRWHDLEGNLREEVAETVLLSRHGGMLVCPARLKPDKEVYVWWPEREREAGARVVFLKIGAAEDLSELAFEFVDVGDFWEIEFPPDTAAREPPSH